MTYIHEQKDWPEFRWSAEKLSSLVANIRYKQGLLLGRMSVLGFQLRNEASLEILTTDVVKSSAIEGENLDPEQVRSSIAKRLGVDISGTAAINGIDIGVEICEALNISTENVTNINLDIPANDVVMLTVTRHATKEQVNKIKEIIKTNSKNL